MLTLLSKSEAQAMSLYPSPPGKPHSCLPFLNPVSLREIHSAPFHSQLSTVIIRIPGAASLTLGLLLFNPSNTGLGSFLKCKQWWALLHKLPKASEWEIWFHSTVHRASIVPGASASTVHLGVHVPAVLSFLSWNEASGHSDMLFPLPGTFLPNPFTVWPCHFLTFFLKVTFSRKLFLIPRPWAPLVSASLTVTLRGGMHGFA